MEVKGNDANLSSLLRTFLSFLPLSLPPSRKDVVRGLGSEDFDKGEVAYFSASSSGSLPSSPLIPRQGGRASGERLGLICFLP